MKLIVRTDGGSRGNPGPAAAGVVIQNEAGDFLYEGGFYLGRQTNNVAEYMGVVHALEAAKQIGGTQLTIFSDSQLLVKQLNREYRVKNETLRGYFDQANRLLRDFEEVSIQHVYREENADADAMVNQALDAQADVGGPIHEKNGSSQTVSKPVPENKLISLNIPAEIQFDSKHPWQKQLNADGSIVTHLVCLGHKQKWEKPSTQEVSVLVYQGKGFLEAADQKKPISAGHWLQVSSGEKAVFLADREPMILLITCVLPAPAKSTKRNPPRLF